VLREHGLIMASGRRARAAQQCGDEVQRPCQAIKEQEAESVMWCRRETGAAESVRERHARVKMGGELRAAKAGIYPA